jgi:hypothetical protein
VISPGRSTDSTASLLTKGASTTLIARVYHQRDESARRQRVFLVEPGDGEQLDVEADAWLDKDPTVTGGPFAPALADLLAHGARGV